MSSLIKRIYEQLGESSNAKFTSNELIAKLAEAVDGNLWVLVSGDSDVEDGEYEIKGDIEEGSAVYVPCQDHKGRPSSETLIRWDDELEDALPGTSDDRKFFEVNGDTVTDTRSKATYKFFTRVMTDTPVKL